MLLKRAQSYIFRQALVSALFIALTLTAVIWLTQAMRFIRLIVNKGLPIETFFYITSLLLPSFFLITLPVGIFFATLFAINKMTNDRELVVLRSAGVSHLGLAKPIAILGLIGMGISYSISLYFMPLTFQEFRKMQSTIRSSFTAGILQEGTFNSIGRGLTMYVRARDGGTIYGILVQDNRKPDAPVTMMARIGTVVTAEDESPRIVLQDGNRQEYDRKTGKVSYLFFERYAFEINLGGEEKEVFREPSERRLHELLFPDPNNAHDRQYWDKLIAEGHNRIVMPLYCLVMPFLALVMLLPGQFNKRGQVWRLVVATGLAATTQGWAIALLNASAKLPALLPLMYLNAIVPFLVSFWIIAGGPVPRLFKPRRAAPAEGA